MKKQEQHDLIWASGHYLFQHLPNNFDKWSDKKLDKYLIDYAWQPFEYHSADFLWEHINSLASGMRDYVGESKWKSIECGGMKLKGTT